MSTTSPVEKAGGATATFVDQRLGSNKFLSRNLSKVFPEHWSFMLGEIALYSFIVVLLTGTYLTLFFKPSMAEVVYEGSYVPLNGVMISEAYASTLNISFDVRGGLLIRQMHHWAALIFVAAVAVHMFRVFFTGAFRKPREFNWLVGVALTTYALRFGGLLLSDKIPKSGGFKTFMDALPGAILVSLVVPGIFASGPWGWFAALATGVTARKTGNLFMSMGVGMAIVVIQRNFM